MSDMRKDLVVDYLGCFGIHDRNCPYCDWMIIELAREIQVAAGWRRNWVCTKCLENWFDVYQGGGEYRQMRSLISGIAAAPDAEHQGDLGMDWGDEYYSRRHDARGGDSLGEI